MADAEDKVALVTGAARRIGADICRSLHQRGCTIALHYQHSEQQALQLQQELNSIRKDSCAIFQADLGEQTACQQLPGRIIEALGSLDVLVNNASRYIATPLAEAPEQHWDSLMHTNARAAFLLSQAARDTLGRSGGCIVNLLDAHTNLAEPEFSLYKASKAALTSLTKSLAREYAPQIRVNAVSPGAMLWPEEIDRDEQAQQDMLAKIPLARLGGSEAIASAVCYLVFDADYVTGQNLAVDGGRRLSG